MPRITKLVATAAATAAALILGAATASAQTVELEQEQGGHCPTVVNVVNHLPSDERCSIHAITEPGTTFDIFQHTGVTEVGFFNCQMEFEAAFDEDGHGYIYNEVLSPEGGACLREPCDEAEGGAAPHRNLEWEAQLNEAGPSSAELETLRFVFCFYAHNPDPASEGTSGTPCLIDVAVNRIEHAYELETGDVDHTSPCLNLGGVIEVEAHWITTPAAPPHNGFEIHHLDDV